MTATTLHYTNCITPQLQIHYATTTNTAAVHRTTSSSCGWGDHCNHCNHSNKHKSNHLSVNQWIRSAIRDSQQPTSPIGFLFWNFRHRLVRYYWYIYLYHIYTYTRIHDMSVAFLPPTGVFREVTRQGVGSVIFHGLTDCSDVEALGEKLGRSRLKPLLLKTAHWV